MNALRHARFIIHAWVMASAIPNCHTQTVRFMYAQSFAPVHTQASIILVGGFHVDWQQLGRYPFRIARGDFDPGAGGAALGEAMCIICSAYD